MIYIGKCVSFVALVMTLTLFSLYVDFHITKHANVVSEQVTAKNYKDGAVQIKRRNDVKGALLGRPPCRQNPFASYLDLPLTAVASKVNTLLQSLVSMDLKEVKLQRPQDNFVAFQPVAACNDETCLGGSCGKGRDQHGRRICGVKALKEKCIVYYAYRNSKNSTNLRLESSLLDKTPCEVHVFSCSKNANGTKSIERRGSKGRLLVHHSKCLGEKMSTQALTLDAITKELGHDRIDLLILNLNGYELPLLQSLSDSNNVQPMQLVTRLHYPNNTKQAGRILENLLEHLLTLGYALTDRNDNTDCAYCSSDLTFIRFQCPESDPTALQLNTTNFRATRKKSPKKHDNKGRKEAAATSDVKGANKLKKVKAVSRYSQPDIYRTVPHFSGHPLHLLVFDGESNTFNTYNVIDRNGRDHQSPDYQTSWCRRCATIVPMLVHALRTNLPTRFSKGSPPFQIMFSTNDSILTACVNNPERCGTSKFAPIISYGTVPSDPKLLPSLQPFPLHFFGMCMFNWLAGPRLQSRQKCKFINKSKPSLAQPKDPSALEWKNLKPQIIWRGTDYKFSVVFAKFNKLEGGKDVLERNDIDLESAHRLLREKWNTLRPRWRGVVLSLEAELDAQRQRGNTRIPWIDCKFVSTKSKPFKESHPGTKYVTADRMGSDEMSLYKYHIDFGGVGGTTWLGTITKLAMPGLLFHHVTAMKDWFFDEIEPWVHYVPVKLDLSDLHKQYQWAESHPEEAERIAKAGTEFALNILTEQNMNRTYEKYFVKSLGSMVNAYKSETDERLDSILKAYQDNDFDIHQFATCGNDSCIIKTRSNGGWNHSLPLGIGNRFEADDFDAFFNASKTESNTKLR